MRRRALLTAIGLSATASAAGCLDTVLGRGDQQIQLFSPPESNDAWMTRVVLAEEWWTEEQEQRVLGLSYPNVLNSFNIPVTGYALVSAYRKKPVQVILSGLASMALKFWYVGGLVRRYDPELSE